MIPIVSIVVVTKSSWLAGHGRSTSLCCHDRNADSRTALDATVAVESHPRNKYKAGTSQKHGSARHIASSNSHSRRNTTELPNKRQELQHQLPPRSHPVRDHRRKAKHPQRLLAHIGDPLQFSSASHVKVMDADGRAANSACCRIVCGMRIVLLVVIVVIFTEGGKLPKPASPISTSLTCLQVHAVPGDRKCYQRLTADSTGGGRRGTRFQFQRNITENSLNTSRKGAGKIKANFASFLGLLKYEYRILGAVSTSSIDAETKIISCKAAWARILQDYCQSACISA